MSTLVKNVITVSFAASLLSGCAVAKTTGKVAALPFKATYETTKFVGKSAYKTTEFAGKSVVATGKGVYKTCLLYTSPSPRDKRQSRMPSSA